MKTSYGYNKIVDYDFESAIAKTKEELKKEGFGILSEIDVQAKFKEKLGKDFGKYVILGACNPALAFEAIGIEKEIGLLLPCNVIVYEQDGKVVVSSILPSKAMGFVENPDLEKIVSQAEPKLISVIERL